MSVLATECPGCGYVNQDGSMACNLCGERLVTPPPSTRIESPPLLRPIIEQRLIREHRHRESAEERALNDHERQKAKGHAMTGAIVIVFLQVLSGFFSSGLLFIFQPLWWIATIFSAALIGAPAGYLISRLGCGPFFGWLVCGSIFGVFMFLYSGCFSGDWSPISFVLGFVSGLFPGVIIGIHVKNDDF